MEELTYLTHEIDRNQRSLLNCPTGIQFLKAFPRETFTEQRLQSTFGEKHVWVVYKLFRTKPPILLAWMDFAKYIPTYQKDPLVWKIAILQNLSNTERNQNLKKTLDYKVKVVKAPINFIHSLPLAEQQMLVITGLEFDARQNHQF